MADNIAKSHGPSNIISKDIRLKRIFVLDTNVLLHDSNSIFAFKGVVVGIPFAVLEELDEFKKERNELGMNARRVIRVLDELRHRGKLSDGVPLNNGSHSILKILPATYEKTTEFCAKTVDNSLIQSVLDLINQGYETTFITKDINLRIKADSLGIETEDYTKGVVTYEDYYKGWISIPTSTVELKRVTLKHLPEMLKEHQLYANEFILLQSTENDWNYRLFRHTQNMNFKEVEQYKFAGDFKARNVQQLMALDLLMDDSIKFVSLLGPAGTGKTFLVLLVGLFKVLRERYYRKFLVSRPIVALGADVGYLPGTLQEKLYHWMQPVHDNLELIFSQMEDQDFAVNTKDRRNRRRHPENFQDQASEIDRLQQKGILSLEAITYMRGRSITNQFVFIDEAQNLTPHEIKTIVSRAGEGSKVIIAGDPYQIDSPYLDFTSNGLTVSSEKFKDQAIFGTAFLEISERSELAKLAAELL